MRHRAAGRVLPPQTEGGLPGRDGDGSVPLELYSLYILARAQGRGLGAALLGAAIGESPAYLWVLEGNPRAQAFYHRHGFRPDGRRGLLPPEWESVPEIRMVREGPEPVPSAH